VTEWIQWVEPFVETDTGTEPVIMRVSVPAAVAQARKTAALAGGKYDSDEEALADFMVVHWAVRKTEGL
jgi:hypothetical protein